MFFSRWVIWIFRFLKSGPLCQCVQAAVAEYWRPGGWQTTEIAVQARSPRSVCWQIRCPAWARFLASRGCHLAVCSCGGRALGLSGVPSIRALIPLRGVHPHDPIASPKPFLLRPFIWRFSFNMGILREPQHLVCGTR